VRKGQLRVARKVGVADLASERLRRLGGGDWAEFGGLRIKMKTIMSTSMITIMTKTMIKIMTMTRTRTMTMTMTRTMTRTMTKSQENGTDLSAGRQECRRTAWISRVDYLADLLVFVRLKDLR
jgi:hypothetical protein